MFILYAVVIGLVLGLITKGNLKYLALRSLYWKGLALSAFIIQLVVFSNLSFVESLPVIFIELSHYISYICLLVFVVRNIKSWGITFAGIGIFLNSLVIFLNGGHMPTIVQNFRNTSVGGAADVLSQGEAVHNSAKMTGDTLLPWLGDIFYLPKWIPFSNVFSIGDILIAAGICIYIIVNMQPVKKLNSPTL